MAVFDMVVPQQTFVISANPNHKDLSGGGARSSVCPMGF